jgi:hypothetical protein
MLIRQFVRLPATLGPPFRNYRLPDVNAFALTNLLFPSQHAVSLKEAKLPGDLYLTGSLVQAIAVTPVDTTLTPGNTVQFTAASRSAQDILWRINPRIGSISVTGLYTAPAKVTQAAVVVVSAISKSTPSLKGGAMVLVYAPAAATGVAVSPDRARVTAGQTLELTATDDGGAPTDVNWTLTPDAGRMKPGWSHGKYIYTAPDTISMPAEIKATANQCQEPFAKRIGHNFSSADAESQRVTTGFQGQAGREPGAECKRGRSGSANAAMDAFSGGRWFDQRSRRWEYGDLSCARIGQGQRSRSEGGGL